MANWLDKWRNLPHKSETPPAVLGTEEYIELGKLPLSGVYARLKELGVQLAGRDDLKWIKAHPDSAEAQRFKTGGEFYFFGAGDGNYVERLKWVADRKDPNKGRFEQDNYAMASMQNQFLWGSNRDQVDAIPRRVVLKK